MIVKILQNIPATRRIVWQMGEGRAHDTLGHFEEYLKPGEKLLDVGAGTCNVALLMQDSGYQVTPLDVTDLSFTPKMCPQIYDGQNMPFKDKQFDTAMILTVLHHVPAQNHDQVINEAKRVAKRIIIIEDVHTSTPHKYLTMLMDSMFNLEFIGHPHSNKNHDEWLNFFERHGLKVIATKPLKSFGVLRHRMYLLEQ